MSPIPAMTDDEAAAHVRSGLVRKGYLIPSNAVGFHGEPHHADGKGYPVCYVFSLDRQEVER